MEYTLLFDPEEDPIPPPRPGRTGRVKPPVEEKSSAFDFTELDDNRELVRVSPSLDADTLSVSGTPNKESNLPTYKKLEALSTHSNKSTEVINLAFSSNYYLIPISLLTRIRFTNL